MNELEGVSDDIRTPDKLIDGVNDTYDGRHMWLAPILPGIVSFFFISLFHFISFHFISFHFISFHFILFHFILLGTLLAESIGNVQEFYVKKTRPCFQDY